jgi:hypothetical protein
MIGKTFEDVVKKKEIKIKFEKEKEGLITLWSWRGFLLR